jgi:hypothetical protein
MTLSTVCSIAPAYADHAADVDLCVKMIGKMHYPENLEAICNRDKVKCQKLVDEWAHWIEAAKPSCERSITKAEHASKPADPAEKTLAVKCIPFAEGDFVTISGQVVKSRQVEEEEGEPPHDYYEIILEKPLCGNGTDPAPIYTQVIDVKPEMLGHYVEVRGPMYGTVDGYNIEQKSIREVGE